MITQQKALQEIIELASHIIETPIAVWRLSPIEQELYIDVGRALPDAYRRLKIKLTASNGKIPAEHVATTGKPLDSLEKGANTDFDAWFEQWGWCSAVAFPIFSRERVIGVVESFSDHPKAFDKNQLTSLRQLAHISGITQENHERAEESRKQLELTQALANAPGFEHAMQLIVDGAKALTKADSSVIFIFDPKSGRFTQGARSPYKKDYPHKLPRSTGLTQRIIKTGELYFCNDTNEDEHAHEARGREMARSLMGFRLDGPEWLGVIYVRAQRPNHFHAADKELLTQLAAQVSVVLGWSRFFLKPIQEIEQAVSAQFCLEQVLVEVASKIQASQKFDYVSIQLIRKDEQVIETFYHTDGTLTGIAKHSLETDSELQDIQVDIALSKPPRIEIISGWYKKFDQWIYDEFHHNEYVRVWVPIILIRNENGEVIDDSSKFWEVSLAEEKELYDERLKRGGYSRTLSISLPNDTQGKLRMEVIGTIDAGYRIPDTDYRQLIDLITVEKAIELAGTIARLALALRRPLLPYVLETIADRARHIIRATSASLHFLYDKEHKRFSYEVCSGKACLDFLDVCPPRHDKGLGWQALKSNRPKFIPSPTPSSDESNDLQRTNPKVWEQKVRAMAAFPLKMDDKEGLLYLHYQHPHDFTDDEIGWVQLFANRAEKAIRDTLHYAQKRDIALTLNSLHAVEQSLVNNPEDEFLLRRIAGNTINILAADVVAIYEYAQAENMFLMPPEIAGQLLVERKEEHVLGENTAPRLMVCGKIPFHTTENSPGDSIMNNPHRSEDSGMKPFVLRERIQSSSGILLKVGTEVMGVMFVHYRRYHAINSHERKIIDLLASYAAISIKNRRQLATLNVGSREIIDALELPQVLELFIKHAVKVTGGDTGDIRLLEDLITPELIIKSAFPIDANWNSQYERIKLEQGVTGWVARHREPQLIGDTRKDERYVPYSIDALSEVSVPMLGEGGQLVGVLSVDSKTPYKFNKRDMQLLIALANQAVIAMQNQLNRDKLVAAETMIHIGEITSQIIHRVNNSVGAIWQRADTLMKKPEHQDYKKYIRQIYDKAGEVLNEVEKMRDWLVAEREPQTFNINTLLNSVIQELTEEIIDGGGLLPAIEFEQSDSGLLSVQGNESKLREILRNIIKNGIEAGGKNLSIKLNKAHRLDKEFLRIEVTDTGSGIAIEHINKIFEPNFTTKGKDKGLGLGLWWTRTYLRRLGGDISVSSEEGKGSKFVIMIPVVSPITQTNTHGDT